MSGAPYNALKEAVLEIGTNIYSKSAEERPFEDYLTLLYDDKLQTMTFKSSEEYKQYITRSATGGSTNFKIVFDQIL
jgi:hypothetical protein